MHIFLELEIMASDKLIGIERAKGISPSQLDQPSMFYHISK